MAIRTYKVTLDSKNTIAPEPVYLRQGDKTGAVVIDATLMDNGSPVSLSGLTPMFKANTADGKAVIADSTGFNIVNASGGEFTYQVPNALSSVPGKITTAYFSFSDSSGSESTFDVAFIINKAVDATQAQADDYITIIDGTLRSLEEKINDFNTPETFTNLAAIKAKYPSGKNGIMVAADNGHKYIWANSTWTDAGVYQSVGIANGSITQAKLDQSIVDEIDNTKTLASWAYPITHETVKIISNADGVLSVTLPSALEVSTDFVRLDSNPKSLLIDKIPLTNGGETVTMQANQMLVLNVEAATVKVVDDTTISKETGHLILLGVNHYGYMKGPWSIYQLTGTPSEKNTMLASWAYPTADRLVKVTPGDSFDINVALPSALEVASDFARLDTNSKQATIDKITLTNGDENVLLPNNKMLVLNVEAATVKVVDNTTISKETGHLILLGVNHYGYMKGPWSIYQLTGTPSERNTTLASWAYPITHQTVEVTISDESNLNVTLPSALEVASDFARLNGSSKVSMIDKITLVNGGETLSMAANQMLVLNVEAATVKVVDDTTISKETGHLILLGVNHYGYMKGPWSVYQRTESTDDAVLPLYYFQHDYIKNKVAQIADQSRIESGVNFVYFTDSHWDANASQQGKLIDYITAHSSIETTFFGGDIPSAYGTSADLQAAIAEYAKLAKSTKYPIYGVHGNHDFAMMASADSDQGTTLPSTAQYDVLMRSNEMRVVGVGGKNYYYLDNQAQKVRYVVVDDFENLDLSKPFGVVPGISQAQLDWLINEAFAVDGYTFVVFSHAPSDAKLTSYLTTSDVLQKLLIAINNKQKYSFDDGTLKGNADYSSTKNIVAVHMSGHNHRDESNTDQGVLSVSTMCDAMYYDDPNYTGPRAKGSINEHCIDVVSLDTTARLLKLCRVGAGRDREFSY